MRRAYNQALEDVKKEIRDVLIEYQKFLIKNELMGSNAFYNAERFLSEIEPDNEKPYLFYEGEKYYFGEEYEFSDHPFSSYSGKLKGYLPESEFPLRTNNGEYKHIRKIDHTTKYKKLFLELKEQAEKDGVNLKELI